MLNLLFSIIFALIVIVFCFWKLRKHRHYWSNRGIPGPPSNWFFGNLLSLIDPEYPGFLKLRDWTKKYGKYYGYQEGWDNILVVSDVDMLQELFIRKFEYFHARKQFVLRGDVDNDKDVHVFDARGARWRRLRAISSPTFSVNSLKKIMPTVADSVKEMLRQMEKLADSSRPFDILPHFQELSMDVISRVAMGQSTTLQFRNPMLANVKGVFERPATAPFVVSAQLFPFIRPLIRWIALTSARLRGAAFAKLKDQIAVAVAAKRNSRALGEKSSTFDFIDLFLEAEAEEEVVHTSDGDINSVKVLKRLTEDEIAANCFVFLLAGFDTTANSLGYVAYHLATDERVMRKLQEEIDSVCCNEDDDDVISYEQLLQLRYMDCVLKESLRLHPLAAIASTRMCMKACQLGNVDIEPGIAIVPDPFTVHMNPKLWGSDADRFRPERWEEQSEEKRHMMAWFGFGAGPRMCIGMRLALMEERLALAHLLKKFDLLSCPSTEKELRLWGAIVVAPRTVTVQLKRRRL